MKKTFTYQLYQHPGDLQALIGLVNARPIEYVTDFPSAPDLYEMLEMPETQANTVLWEDETGLVAFAILNETTLSFEFAQRTNCDEDLAADIVAWASAKVRQAQATIDDVPALDTSCRDEDYQRIALLEKLGFVWHEAGGIHMYRPLDEAISDPELPPGFTIRGLAGEQEVEAWVAMHRAAWGTEYMTVEYRLAMLNAPDHDIDMDLVAVAPDGRLAAYCVCWISADENEMTGRKDGYTDPIATHPDFQRLGLASTLMLAGMRLLKARGMHTARLGTSQENLAMIQTARRVGFYDEYRTSQYIKRL